MSTDLIPIYIITGFLDSGKTTSIIELIQGMQISDYRKTLLIVCEQGEVAYDVEELSQQGVTLKYIDDERSFEYDYICELEKETSAERVIVEYNGMWNPSRPKVVWDPAQILQIMFIDASTFDMYLSNLKALIADQIRQADLIIFGRCGPVQEKLSLYRQSARALNRNANIVFRTEDGAITFDPGEYLPYDIDANEIELDDGTFAAFYIDAMENPDRYVGKHVRFSGIVISEKKDACIVGRIALTCCSEDLSVFGLICDLIGDIKLNKDDWVDVDCVMGKEYSEKYELWHPICKVKKISMSREPGKKVITVT